MKKITAFVAALALAGSMTAAHAGGPVIVPDEGEPEVITGGGSSLGGGAIVAGLAALLLIAAVADSGDDDDATGSTAE